MSMAAPCLIVLCDLTFTIIPASLEALWNSCTVTPVTADGLWQPSMSRVAATMAIASVSSSLLFFFCPWKPSKLSVQTLTTWASVMLWP